jgi:hypothetical protein
MSLSRRERLRRGARICINFTRSLAYYRAGWRAGAEDLLRISRPNANFWRQTNSNALDISVLEWCKIFSDARGRHGWRRLVSDRDAFLAGMFSALSVDSAGFNAVVAKIKTYRDKFVAHLDEDLTMNIPEFDLALKAVFHLSEHIRASEAGPGDMVGLLQQQDACRRIYEESLAEAAGIFRRANSM